jgi:phage replication O-like protein O
MASPQLEDGYTKIADEILDKLAGIRVPGEAMQVLLVIIRKTYGFDKKHDWIALSQFLEITGIQKPHVRRAINKLCAMKIICVAKKGNDYHAKYCFNKNYDEWIPLPKKATRCQKRQLPLPKKAPTINNTTIENSNVVISDSSNKRQISMRGKKFTPPLPSEVRAYAESINFDLDADYFCNWYGSKNWMIGKNKMTNWKLAVQTWRYKREEKQSKRAPDF